jgi:hypothetical protein
VVWNVHAAKVITGVSAVHDMAIGEDMGEGAFLTELAVSLRTRLAEIPACADMSYLGEVLAGRALGQRLVRVQKGTRLASLTCALPVELAGDV